jgi:DNA-directed RNA polymerase subunit RPC12/RpoP
MARGFTGQKKNRDLGGFNMWNGHIGFDISQKKTRVNMKKTTKAYRCSTCGHRSKAVKDLGGIYCVACGFRIV